MTETQKHQKAYGFIRDRMSCGWEHVVAILEDGTVKAFGDNRAHQCDLDGWTDIVKIQCGPHRTVGLRKDGTVLSTKGDVFTDGRIPGADVDQFNDIIDIGTGLCHIVGLKYDGTVVACGFNDHGQCDVEGWKDVKQVFAVHNHTIGLCYDGSLLYCGANNGGSLNLEGIESVKTLYCGLNDTVIVTADDRVYRTDYDSKTPIQLDITGEEIAQVDFSVDHFMILKTDGTVLHFGFTEDRCDEVGDWTGILTILCTRKVSAGTTHDKVYMTGTHGTRTLDLSGIACQLEAENIMAFVTKKGMVTVFIKNTMEECGSFQLFDVLPTEKNEEIMEAAETVERTASPHKSGMAWEHHQKYGYLRSRMAGGLAHTAAVLYDGTAQACGANGYQQCNVHGWKNMVSIACSSGLTMGVDRNGSFFYTGALGNKDDYTPGGTPLAKWPHNMQAVYGYVHGYPHVAGLTRDGKVYAYGYNEDGECDVSGWTDIVEVCIQHSLTAGIRKDGTVVLSGKDAELKDVVSKWTDIEHLYNGVDAVSLIGLKYDGTVVSTMQNPAYDMSAWKDVISISVGMNCISGLTGNGHLYLVGESLPQSLANGIDNVLCADVGYDVLRVAKGDHTTFVDFLHSDGTVSENHFQADALAFQNGFLHSMMVMDDGELVVHVFADNVKEAGLDETDDWEMLAPASGNTPSSPQSPAAAPSPAKSSSGGCYVATCVYGSYDCPEVWTLRRFRDGTLGSTWYGRAFIHTYYAVSPTLVKWFGETTWFKKMWRGTLDRMVQKLLDKGVENTPYEDKEW